jgi:hypothetical protein
MRFTKTIASASVAAVLGLAGVSVAGATSSSGPSQHPAAATAAATTAATSTAASGKAASKKAGTASLRRRIRRQAAAIAAKTIGITHAVLVQELRAGKTIATIATEHGVQPQAVIDALKAAATAKIDAAKAANKITAARAAKLEHRLDTLIPKLVNDWHPRQHVAG